MPKLRHIALHTPDPEAAKSQKMSRSKGAGGLADLIAKQGGERIRFFLLRTHYRSTVLFSDEAIAEADTLLLTIPNQLGVAYNAHIMEGILKTIAPALGWR